MRYIVLIAFLVGCGDAQLAATEWSAPNGDCTRLAFFPDAENYSASVVCYENGGVAVQFERGTYAIGGDRLATRVAEASCQSTLIGSESFSVDGSRLTIGGVTFDRAFQRIDPSTSVGGTFRRGCVSF